MTESDELTRFKARRALNGERCAQFVRQLNIENADKETPAYVRWRRLVTPSDYGSSYRITTEILNLMRGTVNRCRRLRVDFLYVVYDSLSENEIPVQRLKRNQALSVSFDSGVSAMSTSELHDVLKFDLTSVTDYSLCVDEDARGHAVVYPLALDMYAEQ